MNRKFLLYAMAVVLAIPIIFGVSYWAYWNYYLRYKPVTIVKSQLEIEKLLQAADYVSPALNSTQKPPKFVYLIMDHACKPCRAYEDSETLRFEAAGVETRIIVFAPLGIDQSSAVDRSTVAELWLNRNFDLYTAWRNDPNWDAPNIRSADGDLARTAVVEAGRKFIKDLAPYLRENRVDIRYPLVIWRDDNNTLKVCACSDPKMYHFVREELGVPDTAPVAPEAVTISASSASSISASAASSLSTPPEAATTEANPLASSTASKVDLGPGG